MSTTKKLTTSAILVAMSVVLALVSKVLPFQFLQGGSVTFASMVPIIFISMLIDVKWGLLSGVVYGVIQMMMGFYPAPTPTFINNLLVILLDYIIAFGVLGLAGAFYKMLGRKVWSAAAAGFIVTLLRYVSHIISGVLIWGGGKEEGQTVLAFSLTYNGGYMIPEIIISTVVIALIAPILKKNKILA